MERRVVLTVAGILSFLIVSVVLIGTFNITNSGILTVINLILLAGLFGVTTWYAAFTLIMANANVEMAEEMRAQRITVSRPYMIQKAMPIEIGGNPTGTFSHFEFFNEGNGTAIELQASLLDKEENPKQVLRDTSVRAGKSPYGFGQAFASALAQLPDSEYYVLCEYQSIFSRTSMPQKWYQTWLPFRWCASSGCVDPDELQLKEVEENERVNAWAKLHAPSATQGEPK